MSGRLGMRLLIPFAIAVVLVGCGTASAPTPTPTRTAATPTTAATTPASSPTAATPAPAAPSPTATTASASQSTGDAVVFQLVPAESEARYRAREQLLGRSLPNDAVGRTNAVEGRIVFNSDGTIDSERSRFTVDLRTLQSDETRRDNYIKQNTLEVDQYPNAEFQPTTATGLPWPLPSNGQLQFQLEGNLTVHGVTKPVTWNVQATVEGQRITGTATTQVTFEDFGMTPPRVPVVLSLEDTITLELDFTFERVS